MCVFTFTHLSTVVQSSFSVWFLRRLDQMLEPQVKTYEKEIRLSGGSAIMGKTVPSYRMAVEWEIDRWRRARCCFRSGA